MLRRLAVILLPVVHGMTAVPITVQLFNVILRPVAIQMLAWFRWRQEHD